MHSEQIRRHLKVRRMIDLTTVLLLYFKSFVTIEHLVYAWLKHGVPIPGLDLGTSMLVIWLCYRVFFADQSGD